MASKWAKVCPWYYTERRQPSRAAEKAAALETERKADADGAEAGRA